MLESHIDCVSFFEDRAEVERSFGLDLPEGIHRLRFSGCSALLDDASLRAKLRQGRLLSIQALRSASSQHSHSEQERLQAEAGWREAEAACMAQQDQRYRLECRRSRLFQLLAQLPSRLDRNPELASAHARLMEELAATTQALSEQEAPLRQAQAQLSLKLAQHQACQARIQKIETVVEVQLFSTGHPDRLRFSYQLPCALWRPAHRAMLEGDSLVLSTEAVVWQQTGERWDQVPCRFSTSRPEKPASPPLLTDDRLQLQPRSSRSIQTQVREVDLSPMSTGQPSKIPDMPGIDDGGEAQLIHAPRPCSLPSDGRPQRVLLRQQRLPCTTRLQVWPERSPQAHVKAQATLKDALLPGPVQVGRQGVWMGTASCLFTGAGSPLILGLGPDDGISVQRKVEQVQETTPILGTQKRSTTVSLFLSNTGNTPRLVQIQERILCSEIEEVSIQLLDAGGGRFDPTDGMLYFSLEVPPGGMQLQYRWRLEASSKVRL